MNHLVTEKVAALGSAKLKRIWDCKVLRCISPDWPHIICLTSSGPVDARIWRSSKTLSSYFSAWPPTVLVSTTFSMSKLCLYWLSVCWIKFGISRVIACINVLCLTIILQSSVVGKSCRLFSKREIKLSSVTMIKSLSVLKSSLNICSKTSNPTPQARKVCTCESS